MSALDFLLGDTPDRSYDDYQSTKQNLLDEFVKLYVIGSGGHAKVYEGLYRGEMGCLKEGHSEDEKQAFLEESEILFKLDGAGETPKLLGFASDAPIIITSFCKGQTVDDWQNTGTLTKTQVVSALIEITSSIQDIHHKCVVHNDIKSDNVLITFSSDDICSVHIIDMGLATKSCDKLELTDVSSENYANFSHYAPEVYFGKTTNPRSDVFSLGQLAASLLKVAGAGVSSCPDMNLLVDEMTRHKLESRPTTWKVLSKLKTIALSEQLKDLSVAK